jgi:hypothetical protein
MLGRLSLRSTTIAHRKAIEVGHVTINQDMRDTLSQPNYLPSAGSGSELLSIITITRPETLLAPETTRGCTHYSTNFKLRYSQYPNFS